MNSDPRHAEAISYQVGLPAHKFYSVLAYLKNLPFVSKKFLYNLLTAMVMVSAVVLAGRSHLRGAPDDLPNRDYKAVLEIGGKWLVEYVVSALEKSSSIDEIVVAGDKPTLEKRIKSHKVVQGGAGFVGNALSGFYGLENGCDKVLFMYSDIPLVTPKSLDYVVSNSCPDYDFLVPIARKETLLSFENSPLFKDVKNFRYLNLVDGRFRTANCALVRCCLIRDKSHFVKSVEDGYEARKIYLFASKFKLLRKLGPRLFFRHFIKRDLSSSDAAGFISEKFGINFRVVETIHPETSVDIDDYEDYVAVSNYMEK